MDKNTLNKLHEPLERIVSAIRDFDVILWAGSGLSLYAGYPSGFDLSNIILESARSGKDKAILKPYKNSLMDISNEFSQLYSREALIEVLQANYDSAPSIDPSLHRLIAKIPQICSVITTNYDHLFEIAYENKVTLYTGATFSRTIKGSIDLYKIHGDTSAPDSVILTSMDYAQFYDKLDTVLWNKIKGLLAEKTVVFVGYSLEDKNIQDIFEKIVRQIRPSDKECFIITPTMHEHKLRHLNSICKTTHIPLTGEAFFEYIEAEIRKNIVLDAITKKISVDDAYKICREHGITPTIVNEPYGETTRPVVERIALAPDLIFEQMKIPFSRGANFSSRPDTFERMSNFLDDCDCTEIEIPADDAEFYRDINGIHIPENHKFNGRFPSTVRIEKSGRVENLELKLDNSEIPHCKVQVKALPGNKRKRLVVEMPCITMDILYHDNMASFKFSFKYPHSSTTALADLNRLQLWTGGTKLNFYHLNQCHAFSLNGLGEKDNVESISNFINDNIGLYQLIVTIEDDLKDQFNIQKQFTKDDIININRASSSLAPRTINYSGTFDVKIENVPPEKLYIYDNPQRTASLTMLYDEVLPDDCLELFGKTFILGLRKITLVDPYIKNMNEAKEAAAKKEKIILQYASRNSEAILEYLTPPQNEKS